MVQYQRLYFPKNLERRTGPSPSLSLPVCLDFDRCLFSFFALFDLDRDLDFLEPLSSSSLLDDSDDKSFVLFDLDRDLDFLEPLSSSSLLDDSDDELELNSEELLCC